MKVTDGQRPIRVLIVDDDARVRSAMRTFLVAHPEFEVVGEAGSPATALQAARDTTPCVAVVDVLMPTERDGLALLRAITQQHRIPVIAMSLNNACAESALRAGAHTFLAKDGYSELLVRALKAAHQDT